MNNPQYIEYLNTFGAEIDVSRKPIEVGALFQEDVVEEEGFQILGKLFKKIFYRMRYKFYQFSNLVKHFPFKKDEEERQRLIDSIEKLRRSK